MKLFVYTFISEDKKRETVRNEVFDNFEQASTKLMDEYLKCLSRMDIEDEDCGYSYGININSRQSKAFISDDTTGETCIWTINVVNTDF